MCRAIWSAPTRRRFPASRLVAPLVGRQVAQRKSGDKSPHSKSVLALTLWLALLVPCYAAPSPQEALKQMRVAEGFEVTLVASEPQIRQPLSVSFDARGRMWVLQYLQYPTPAGLKAVSVDQYLRTKYDRVPEPPPLGPKGIDRITICEDTNGDGKPDKFKDYLNDLNLASGFTLGHGGVFVVQPPYLLFYADKNHDDIPDGPPEVLLSGFGMEDSHALANSLTWGPDGWLYGAQGSTVTAKIRGVEFQQGVWRYHPITHEFELFAEGGGNTWGLDFDDEGEVIVGTNFGDVIGLHQVQGGYYVKGFAKHGPLHNPHSYGYLEHMPYTGWKGGRVITGGVVYHGGAFSQQFESSYIAANLLRRSIDWHFLERTGSTFKARYGGSFIETDDVTFRPVDCTVGPDGAVYVSDWCDARASHVDPVDNWEKDTGRIYRIAATERRSPSRRAQKQPGRAGSETGAPKQSFDLAKLNNDELIDLLSHHNDWFRREARNQLAERHDANVLPRLRAQSSQTTNAPLALQSLWTLQTCGGFDDAIASKLLQHSSAPVRAWTIRLLGDAKKITPELRRQIVAFARTERSSSVRSQLACSAKRLPVTDALAITRELIRHDEDTADLHIPLLIWWAIEDKTAAHSDDVLTLLSSTADWQQPMMRQHIIERLARRFATETNSSSRQQCAWMLRTAMPGEQRDAVLRGFDKAWEGQRGIANLQAVAGAFELVWRGGSTNPLIVRVGLRLGHDGAKEKALVRLADAKAPDAERISLAETIGQWGSVAAVPALTQLLDGKPKLQTAAISALENISHPSVSAALVERYSRLSAEARTRARTALASRPAWSKQLISAVESGKIDAKEITPEVLRQMIAHNDPELSAAIEKRWGKLQAQSSEEKVSTINRLKLVLNPSGTTHRFKGDPTNGKTLFTQVCASCHKLFGEGNTIGPELTGSDRKNTEWMLSQIIDPSAFIRPEYVNHNVEMKDDRSLSGLIAEQSDSAITLLDAQNQRSVLNRADMKELRASSTSLMPEGLLEALDPQQVRDLFSYLQQ